jgi:hypothetical protein
MPDPHFRLLGEKRERPFADRALAKLVCWDQGFLGEGAESKGATMADNDHLPPGYRQAVTTAITVFLGFSLTFLRSFGRSKNVPDGNVGRSFLNL